MRLFVKLAEIIEQRLVSVSKVLRGRETRRAARIDRFLNSKSERSGSKGYKNHSYKTENGKLID